MTLCGCLRGRPDEDLLAVFDGHGGQAVAEFCAMLICVVVQEILAAGSFSSMADFWYQVFHQLNNQVEQELGEEAHDSGATAAIALIQQDTVHVANVGDSRAVLGCVSPSAPRVASVPCLTAPAMRRSTAGLALQRGSRLITSRAMKVKRHVLKPLEGL